MTLMEEVTSKQSLQSRVLATKPADWQKFEYIQQPDFKEQSPEAKQKLKRSILDNKFSDSFKVWQKPGTETIYCLDGRHRTLLLEELKTEGYQVPDLLPATFIDCENKKEAAQLVLVYSSIYAKITNEGLFDFVKMYELDMAEMNMTIDLPELDMLEFQSLFNESISEEAIIPQSLQERFIIPPFSIFDSRQGYWQERKKLWNGLFDSQASREEIELVAKSGQAPAVYELRNKMREMLQREPEWDEIIAYAKKKGMHIYSGASVFDPVLTEICYKWFCPEGGSILDPFAGGSVRGIVAGILGYNYIGIDLRKEQVEANEKQWGQLKNKVSTGSAIGWITGDSNDVLTEISEQYDFIFSCPPYHDLEQYSDDPADLSNMSYEQFVVIYQSIIAQSVRKLKANRFACFVVGDIRDEKGFYRNFLQDTIDAFQHSGECKLYNEIILINVAGSLPVRVGRQFESSRKVGKMHQNVLVFYKGDPKKIREEFPLIKVDEYLHSSEEEPNIAMSDSVPAGV